MTVYKMAHAKTHLASLIREALAGEEVTIARDAEPLVRLVPVGEGAHEPERIPGDLVGKLALPDEFFRALSASEMDEWER